MINKEELDAKLKDFKRLVCEQISEFFDSEPFSEAVSEVSSNPNSYLVVRVEMRDCLNEIRFEVFKGKKGRKPVAKRSSNL